jgi:hypothetical protein
MRHDIRGSANVGAVVKDRVTKKGDMRRHDRFLSVWLANDLPFSGERQGRVRA